MVPYPVCSLGHGRSLWTNWRWTNFLLSYQLPLCSKGRPWYWHNLKLIYMGLPLRAMCHKIIGWFSVLISSSKGNATCQLLSGVHRFTDTIASIAFSNSIATCHSLNGWRRFVVPILPRVTRWMDGIALLSPLLGPIYIYIYIGAFSLLPFTSLTIFFLPTYPRASSSFLPSFQVFPLPS